MARILGLPAFPALATVEEWREQIAEYLGVRP